MEIPPKISQPNYTTVHNKLIRPKSSNTVNSKKTNLNKNYNSNLPLRESRDLLRSVNFINKNKKNNIKNVNKNNEILNTTNHFSNTITMFINGKESTIPKKEFYKIKNLSISELKIENAEKKLKIKAKKQKMENENKSKVPIKLLNDMILYEIRNKEYELRNGITRLQNQTRFEKKSKSISFEKIEELYKIILASIKNIDKYVLDDIMSIKKDINEKIISGLNTCEYTLELKYGKRLKEVENLINKIKYIIKYMEVIKALCIDSVENLKFQEKANFYFKKFLIKERTKYNKNLKNILNLKKKIKENKNSPLKIDYSKISTIQGEQSTERNIISSSRYMSGAISENKTSNTTNTISIINKSKNKENKLFLKNPTDYKKSINENNHKNLENRENKYKDDLKTKIKSWKNKTEITKKKIDNEIPNNSLYINTCNIIKETLETSENKKDTNFFSNQEFREIFIKNLLSNTVILDNIPSDYQNKK